jgi:hypothetical protein
MVMAKKLVLVTMVLMLCACIQQAFAMGELIVVTKQTQAKLGLKFTLVAERVDKEAVLVQMEVPREGKLKTLRSVSMTIGQGSGSPMLHAALHTTPGKNGSWSATFQLSPELADKCSVDLVVPNVGGVEYVVYAVQLKGYVTDRK